VDFYQVLFCVFGNGDYFFCFFDCGFDHGFVRYSVGERCHFAAGEKSVGEVVDRDDEWALVSDWCVEMGEVH